MTVPSMHFLLFALASAFVFNLSTAKGWRQSVLLVVNILFLASFSYNPISFIPLICFLAFGFAVLRLTRNGEGPKLFLLLSGVTVFAFLWLKRYSFIPSVVFIPFPYVVVGLSYVFFRILHLIIDNHQAAIDQKITLASYINYTLNFTSLTAGPIQRYESYRKTEEECLPLDLIISGAALERIIFGYFKVAVVSMLLSLKQHEAIDNAEAAVGTWQHILCGCRIAAIYPIYLYFNFSGYVDVVIGVARFFRIELPENFNRPFSSQNFIIFWSKWHITLSNWLKTYIYNPLMMFGITRIPEPAAAPYISIAVFFVTFFLVGLWHGPTAEFIFFGFLQGGGVAANKLYQVVMQHMLGRARYRTLADNPGYQACCRGLTFTWFAFTLFWFWSNWGQIIHFYHLFGLAKIATIWLITFAVATVVLATLETVRGRMLSVACGGVPVLHSRYFRTASATALLVVTVAVIVLLDSPTPDIVYKTF